MVDVVVGPVVVLGPVEVGPKVLGPLVIISYMTESSGYLPPPHVFLKSSVSMDQIIPPMKPNSMAQLLYK